MDYQGTPHDDIIDQTALGLGAVTIYGMAGNDRITICDAKAIGGAGDDVIVAASAWATALYWDAPRGVVVDLGAGTAEDGYGGIDRLVGIRVVQGSGFDDVLRGGAADEFFHGAGGNDRFDGGAGYDTVSYYFEKSTAAAIRYDVASDTFTVIKRFTNGDHGTDILTGIERIEFSGAGADDVAILRAHYVGDFRPGASLRLPFPAAAGLTQSRSGDFNGDGHADLAVVTQIGTGTAPAPTFILLGDGKGGLRDATPELFGQAPLKVVGGGRTLVADFNGDGRSDIFQLDFGNDAPPFPGGVNSLYLSGADGRLHDASATLPQRPDLNHGASAADLDSDGDIDILVNTLDEGNLLLINDGAGRFSENRALLTPSPTQSTSTYSGIADLNGDLAPDLVLGAWDGDPLALPTRVLFNDGQGRFNGAPVALPAAGLSKEIVLDVKTLDLNGDALPDLMLSVTNGGANDVFYHTGYIQLLVNDGAGGFRDETAARLPQSKQAAGPGWFMSLSAVDLNNDGLVDILAESAGGEMTSRAYLNRGGGSFAPVWESGRGERAQAADMNGDGLLDLVLSSDAGLVTVMSNTLENGHVYRAGFGGARLRGSSGDDLFIARASLGEQVFDGAAGLDLARLPGTRADYAFGRSADTLVFSGHGGAIRLDALERVAFADGALAFDLDGAAGQAYRLYQAAFGRMPDVAGLGFWIDAMDAGATLPAVAAQFLASAELARTYGQLSDPALITAVYHNVLGRAPDAGGLGFWQDYLDGGGARADLLAAFSESAENQQQTLAAIADGIAYLPLY